MSDTVNDTVNDTAAILADAATRLFEEHLDEAAVRQARAGAWLDAAWVIYINVDQYQSF